MYIADLHIHSKYSRATSREMTPEILARYAKEKGVGLLGTGDVIHPKYLEELKEKLKPTDRYGIFEYDGVDFILSGEISNIYSQDGKLRKRMLEAAKRRQTVHAKLEAMLMEYVRLSSSERTFFSLAGQKIATEIHREETHEEIPL